VYVIYLCPKDVLAVGDYHFDKSRFDASAADFSTAFSHFSSLYGPTIVVASRPPANEPSERETYMAAWHVGSLQVTIGMLRDGEFGADSWQTFVVMTRRQNNARSNNSIQSTRER
jgi:hypothetical protein